MAPKRSLSAASDCSASRKRGRGASSTRPRGRNSSDTVFSLPARVTRGGSARNASRRGRGRGRGRGMMRSPNEEDSAFSPLPTTHNPSLVSTASDDSGPMSLHLTGSGSILGSDHTLLDRSRVVNSPRFDSDLTLVDKLERGEESAHDELTVDKLMGALTGALPRLRGALAAHARAVLAGRPRPLGRLLRALAARATRRLPHRKSAVESDTRADRTMVDKGTMKECVTEPEEKSQPPVVSYLWQQSLDRWKCSDSNNTLTSNMKSDEASSSKCGIHPNSPSNQDQSLQLSRPPTPQTNNITQITDRDPSSHLNRDPRLQNSLDPPISTNGDLSLHINKDSTPLFSSDAALNDQDPRLNSLAPSTRTNTDLTSQTNEDSTQQMHCDPTPITKEDSTQQMHCDPIPVTNGDSKQQVHCNPTPVTKEDQTQQMHCDPTPNANKDSTQQMHCDSTPETNKDSTQQMHCDLTIDITEDSTQMPCDLTTNTNEETTRQPDGDPDATFDLTLDDDDLDMDTILRRIDDITSVHEQTLQNDDDDLDNLFPAVAMPHTVGRMQAQSSTETEPRWGERGARRRGRGRGARGRGARRAPRERPDSPEEALTALENAKITENDTLTVARPQRITSTLELQKDDEEDEEMGVAETYAEYSPAKLTFGRRHPDAVVETASLASVQSADVTYSLALPGAVTGGLLSALQLEAVVYAAQAHDQLLPDGTRAGFLVGDGAGVGKGRTIAGIIFENYLRGRKRAVWVSVSNDLKYDAERDLKDIGAEYIQVHPLNKMNYTSISSPHNGRVSEGVVFSTYSALIGFTTALGVEHNTRLKQLLAWCGTDFDGCIVFDECHRAKNLCPVTATKPSKTGLAVLNLQRLLPKARLVYASATGASEPKNMAYMVRLGIWGEGTPFLTFKDFLVAVEKRGVGAMEIVAMDMKLRGMYIARQLSFHGVTFKIEEVPLSLAFRETYDKAVALWVKAMEEFETGLELVNPSHKWRKVVWGQFWGAHQRFFKYLCIAAKVGRAVALAQQAVRGGRCVVIGLQSTGEARTLDQLERDDGKLTDFICTAKGVFQSLVEKQFPDPDHMKDKKSPPPSPHVRQQTKKMKQDLLKKIVELGRRLPPNTLDQLVDELGGSENVAEMTGRKGRVVQLSGGRVQYESRAEADVPLETLNLTEKQRFMDGEKHIAIISEAASSGISLQSDKRVKNHRRRVHITLELPWSADRAIQQFGRTHRSNQVNAPEYIFLISDLAGERRFASTVAKRLESLGALTHGDRRATETRDLSQFNIENKFGRNALRRVQRAVRGTEAPLVAPPAHYRGDFLRDAGAALAAVGVNLDNEQEADMQRFLNRLLGVPVLLQNQLFQYFSDTFAAVVHQAKREGRFDLGILDLGSAGECVRRVRCVRFLRRHATGRAPVELHTVQSERGLDWEKADQKFSQLSDPDEGFYLSRKRWNNNYNAILCVAAANNHNTRVKMYNIYRPNLGLQLRPESLAEISRTYARASRAAAREPWRAQHEQARTECSHQYWRGACSAAGCEVGLRVRTYHVLSGCVLAVWAQLEEVLGALYVSARMQVVRVRTEQGTKIVGTLLPKRCIELLTEELKNEALSFTEQNF